MTNEVEETREAEKPEVFVEPPFEEMVKRAFNELARTVNEQGAQLSRITYRNMVLDERITNISAQIKELNDVIQFQVRTLREFVKDAGFVDKDAEEQGDS